MTIVILALANLTRLRLAADLDGNLKNMQTMLTWALSFVLLLSWFLFFSRFRPRMRWIGLAVVILLGFAVRSTVRFDGSVSGSGMPKLAWKWTPKRTGEVAAVQKVTAPLPLQETPDDYPGYLGRDRRGVIENVKLDPDWTSHPPERLWSQPIGLGWSAFAIVGQSAITQEQRAGQEVVVSYDLKSGKTIWMASHDVRFSEPMGGDGPRSTPMFDSGRIYALGGTGLLDCLDAATGKHLWTRDTLNELGLKNVNFGKTSSPLVCDGVVIVSGGQDNKNTLLAYHCADGSPAWQAGTDKASYSSPMVATLAGRKQIVSINAASITAHDPADGRILWQRAWGQDQWPKCAQPVVVGEDRLLLAASFNAGTILVQIKAEPNDQFSVTDVWKNNHMKSEFSNVVTKDGYIYGLDDGILACLDVATGERKWKGGHYGHGQVILVGDLLLVQTEQGPVALAEAKPDAFHEAAKLDALHAKTWNTPALAGSYLLVRNDQEAACFKLPLSSAKAP